MTRYINLVIAVLLAAAVAVAIATGVRVVTLPQPGSVRHAVGAPGSSLDQLRQSLNAIGISQPDGTIQHFLTRSPSSLSFLGTTYWTSDDVTERRNAFLWAGGLLEAVLLFVAVVLLRLNRRVVPPEPPTSTRAARTAA